MFSPGRAPQVEKQGHLTAVDVPQLPMLRAEDTARIAGELVRGNETALRTLKEQGACDLSYSLPERGRFRVNIFRQRGTFAIVMRVIASRIPTLAELKLPSVLAESASLKNGIVLVTGSHRLGQVVDARGDHRSDQRDPRRAHPHDRGSDRVPAPPQEGDHPPARAAQRHADVCRGAEGGAAPGAEGDPRRRDARPRDHRDRVDGGRDRPPGVLDAAHDRRVEDRRPHHRHVRVGRSAGDPHAAGEFVPLHHFAAAGAEHVRRPYRGARDSQVDDADARVSRTGRGRRPDTARCDARRRAGWHAGTSTASSKNCFGPA